MPRLIPARWTALAALLALLAVQSGEAAEPPGPVDVIHYDVAMSVDFERRSIRGSTTMAFRTRTAGQTELVFSGNALTITDARMGTTDLKVSRRDGRLILTLPSALGRDEKRTITVAYEGKPARGLVFGEGYAYSSYFTCDWMICDLDQFGDKATFSLAVTGPAGMTAHGPGTLRGARPAGSGLKTWRWRDDRPYSAYIYGFALGDFIHARVRTSATDLVYLSEGAAPDRMEVLFAPTRDMMRFLEDKAGVPFPHKSYVQLLVPGSDAQEASNFSIIGARVLEPRLKDPQEDWVIVHEMAHQWWGNLITCSDWSQFWLNEGITTFMVAAWKEQEWGRAAYDKEMGLLQGRVDTAVRAGVDRHLTSTVPYPNLATRRAVQYSKGALFMDRLRRELGDEVFWRALKTYTRAHAGGVVDSRDFQRDFERVSKRDLSALFNEWVY